MTDPQTIPHVVYENLPMAADRRAGWAKLRDLGPVLQGDGWYYLTNRDDVLAALRNPEVFSSTRAFDGMVSDVPLVPLAFDAPEHTRYGRILHPFFSPHALGTALPSLQGQAAEIIADIAQRDECEVMADLATPYPSQVFLTLFGLPLEDRDKLIAWKNAIIDLGLGLERNPAKVDLIPAAQLFGYLTEAVDAQRRQPRDGILSRLLHGDDALTDAEALGLSFVFILAGLDTVTSAIGTDMLELARRPDLCEDLRHNPDRVAQFIEEMIRLDPAAPVVGRITTREVTVAGVTPPRARRSDCASARSTATAATRCPATIW